MILKYAVKEWRLYWKVNIIVFLQLVFAFLITILCVASVTTELRFFRGISHYFEKDGYLVQSFTFIHPDGIYMVEDSVDLKNDLKNAEVYGYSYVQNWGCKTGEGIIPVEIRAYDEAIVRQFQPPIKGKWIDKKKELPEELNAVITENHYGIKIGDVVYAQIVVADSLGDIDTMQVPLKITGILNEGTEVFGGSLPQGDDINYKSCYEKLLLNKKENSILLISKEALLDMANKKTHLGVCMFLTGTCFITYHDNITENEREHNLSYIKDCGDITIMEKLDAVSRNNHKYMAEILMELSPVLIGALLFAVLSQISIRAIITNLQMKNYKIYRMCGMSKVRCCGINLMSNALLMVMALVVVASLILIVKILPIATLDLVAVNKYQVAACAAIMAVNLAVSSILPMMTICKFKDGSIL